AGRSVCPAVPSEDPGLARRRRRPAPVPNARSRGGGGTGVPSGDPLGAGGRCGSGMGRRAAALAGAVTLPALANLFAVCDENPLRADALQRTLQHSGEFAAVWRPAPGWVAAAAPLPGSVPDGAQVRGLGFAFAEGRDLVECQLEHAAQLAAGAPQRLASLPGDFGFIHFQADGSATVVRSCGGLVPFYLWQDGGRAAVRPAVPGRRCGGAPAVDLQHASRGERAVPVRDVVHPTLARRLADRAQLDAPTPPRDPRRAAPRRTAHRVPRAALRAVRAADVAATGSDPRAVRRRVRRRSVRLELHLARLGGQRGTGGAAAGIPAAALRYAPRAPLGKTPPACGAAPARAAVPAA